MAKCRDCKQEMLGSESCDQTHLVLVPRPPGATLLALASATAVCPHGPIIIKRNTAYYDINTHCHDCGIANGDGHVHHFGCDIERCPNCGGQLISCGCKVTLVCKTPD